MLAAANRATVANGTVANGTVANGTVANGTVANGTAANGTAANGTAANGTAACGLALFESGSAVNAIPRDAQALLWLEAGGFEAWNAALQSAAEAMRTTLGSADPDFCWTVHTDTTGSLAVPPGLAGPLLAALAALPDGLVAMEDRFPGVARTSSNIGVVTVKLAGSNAAASVQALVRSSDETAKESRALAIESGLAAAGFAVSRPASTVAWPPLPDSELVRLAVQVHTGLFGDSPLLTATHGGLECALFRLVDPDLAMISFGPTIRYPHSPDERIHIPSVQPFWMFLTGLLAALP
jgi:dipeptidase D